MDATIPLTKWASRKRNDLRAQSIYRRRPDIDRRLEEMRLERQLREMAL